MKIAVLVKQVADTAARIGVLSDGSGVDESGAQKVLNPYDEYAVEQAILLKEAQEAEVVIVNIGPDSADEAVKTALAMGADRALVLRDDTLGQADASLRAECLAAMLARESFDLVFCGKQSVDSDTHQVGPAVAQKLGMPVVSFIDSFQWEGEKALVQRDADGVRETLEVSLPALFTCTKGLNEPRYPSLPGIMQAAGKPKEVLSAADLGLDLKAKSRVLRVDSPPERAEGRVLEGEIPAQAHELVQLLRDEAHAV